MKIRKIKQKYGHKFFLFTIIFFIIVNNFAFAPTNILSWDVFGYYLYLPLRFIYHDLGLSNISIINEIIDKYHNTGTLYQIIQLPDNAYVLKYSMGLSFFYAPFFFIGHLVALTTSYPSDGFSVPYQYSIFIGGIIYSIFGIIILLKILSKYFNKTVAYKVILLIVFATNYIIHITTDGQNAMSHNYLFFAYSLIIWLTILWHEDNKMRYIVFLSIICGVSILSRPSEIICLIIPLLWNVYDLKSFKNKCLLLFKHKKQVFVFYALIFSIGLFQLIYWKINTGKFLFYSYDGNAGEGFEFLSPYIIEVLFSFRKGWLIYTPIMIFAIFGFYHMYKYNRLNFTPFFLFFIVNLYIISSWSCWWYAQSFSQRAFISSYPIMAISLGYFFSWLDKESRVIKTALYSIMFLFLVLNVFQTIQFQKGIISGDRMTFSYYLKSFGKLKIDSGDEKLLLVKRTFNGIEQFENKADYHMTFDTLIDLGINENIDTNNLIFERSFIKMDNVNIYSPSFEYPYFKITQKDHVWVKVSAQIYPTEDNIKEPFSLVVHFLHKNKPYKYNTYDSEKMSLKINHWNYVSFFYLTPEVRKKSDSLKTYFWNRGKAAIFVSDFKIEIFEKKP